MVRRQRPGDGLGRAADRGARGIRHDRDDPADFVWLDFPYNVQQRSAASAVMLAAGLVVSLFAFRAESPARWSGAWSPSPEEAARFGGER